MTWSPICNPWPVARLAGLVSPEYNDRDQWTGWLTQYDLWAPFFTGTYIISHQRPVHDIDKKFSLRLFSDFILNPCSNRFPWFGPTENNFGIWPSISIHSVCSLSRNIFYHQTARKNLKKKERGIRGEFWPSLDQNPIQWQRIYTHCMNCLAHMLDFLKIYKIKPLIF